MVVNLKFFQENKFELIMTYHKTITWLTCCIMLTLITQVCKGGDMALNDIYKLSSKEIEYYDNQSKEGDIEASKILADYFLFYVDNHSNAIKYLRRIAAIGSAVSYANLAVALKNSSMIEERKESVKWFELAAEAGDEGAQYNLARMYEKGDIVNNNYCKSFYWYKKLAESNNLLSILKVATFYQEGKCAKIDQEKACHWWKILTSLTNEKSHIGKTSRKNQEINCGKTGDIL